MNEAGVVPRSQEVFHKDGWTSAQLYRRRTLQLSVQWHRETSEAPPKFLSPSTLF